MKPLQPQPIPPQRPLPLDAAMPDADAHWCAGGSVIYLGETLTLVPDTACRSAARLGSELHLPLPPAASPQQIRDAAESWLRDAALQLFTTTFASIVAQAEKSALAGRQLDSPAPCRIKLSFGRRSDWAKYEGDVLRCHWRLIEQPARVIEQVLQQAVRQAPAPANAHAGNDLFALA